MVLFLLETLRTCKKNHLLYEMCAVRMCNPLHAHAHTHARALHANTKDTYNSSADLAHHVHLPTRRCLPQSPCHNVTIHNLRMSRMGSPMTCDNVYGSSDGVVGGSSCINRSGV
jgi:hypothetical protein